MSSSVRHVHGYPTHEEGEKIEIISGLPLARDMTYTVIMHSLIPSELRPCSHKWEALNQQEEAGAVSA